MRDASPVIEAVGLEKRYGDFEAVRGIDLSVKQGRCVGLLGPNGAGKTTTMRMIMGLSSVTGGELSVFGVPVARLGRREVARIGLVPQEDNLDPELTVRENLETGFAATDRTNRFIQDEVFELFPILKDMLGRRGGDLSGGQQQQLAIGRALVARPSLLVLDEPTEGIQPSIIKDIGRAIAYLRDKGEMAIVLVEQYFEFARDLADAYAVMDRGQVVLSGARNTMSEHHVRSHLSV